MNYLPNSTNSGSLATQAETHVITSAEFEDFERLVDIGTQPSTSHSQSPEIKFCLGKPQLMCDFPKNEEVSMKTKMLHDQESLKQSYEYSSDIFYNNSHNSICVGEHKSEHCPDIKIKYESKGLPVTASEIQANKHMWTAIDEYFVVNGRQKNHIQPKSILAGLSGNRIDMNSMPKSYIDGDVSSIPPCDNSPQVSYSSPSTSRNQDSASSSSLPAVPSLPPLAVPFSTQPGALLFEEEGASSQENAFEEHPKLDQVSSNCDITNITTNNNELYFPSFTPLSMNESNIVNNSQSLTGLKYDLIDSQIELRCSKEITIAKKENIIVKKEDVLFSVRDLALASTSSQDIQYIDDEDCLVPASYEVTPPYKTETENSKIIQKFSEKTILEIEDLIKSLAESTNYSFFYNTLNKTPPSKSNLKRKLSTQGKHDKKTLKRSELKFTNVTIFYFERTQGFCSVPSKGGSTLGMNHQHFYITTLPIDEYEHKKQLKRLPMQRNRTIIYKRSDSMDAPKSVEALSIVDRVYLLESSQVHIENSEEDDCSEIRSSRALAGCDCKDYCYPDTCFCNMSGIECQVDRPNFPCGCTRENCKNSLGRNEYNPSRVKTHFIKTMRKIKSENKTTRFSKRKQSSPNKVLLANPELSLIHT